MTTEGEWQLDGEIAYIDSVILEEKYRSTRLFLQGFRHLTHLMSQENPHIKQVRFNALADNQYIVGLYGKFAQVIGEQEGVFGREYSFSSPFEELLRYLNRR